MLRFTFIAVPTFVLSTLFGAFMWWAFSPLLFDEVVDDHLQVVAADETLLTGTFVGQERTHKGAGNAQLVSKASGGLELHFSNFEVTNGLDLKAYLSDNETPKLAKEVLASKWVKVSALKCNKGNQVCRLFAGTDATQIKFVVI